MRSQWRHCVVRSKETELVKSGCYKGRAGRMGGCDCRMLKTVPVQRVQLELRCRLWLYGYSKAKNMGNWPQSQEFHETAIIPRLTRNRTAETAS